MNTVIKLGLTILILPILFGFISTIRASSINTTIENLESREIVESSTLDSTRFILTFVDTMPDRCIGKEVFTLQVKDLSNQGNSLTIDNFKILYSTYSSYSLPFESLIDTHIVDFKVNTADLPTEFEILPLYECEFGASKAGFYYIEGIPSDKNQLVLEIVNEIKSTKVPFLLIPVISFKRDREFFFRDFDKLIYEKSTRYNQGRKNWCISGLTTDEITLNGVRNYILLYRNRKKEFKQQSFDMMKPAFRKILTTQY